MATTIVPMKVEYFHASKYGNGALVAEEFKKQMAARGVPVNVHHIRDARPTSTNGQERLNMEIRRRSRVVGVFPSLESYAA